MSERCPPVGGGVRVNVVNAGYARAGEGVRFNVVNAAYGPRSGSLLFPFHCWSTPPACPINNINVINVQDQGPGPGVASFPVSLLVGVSYVTDSQ